MQVFERLKEARRNGENGFTLIELLIVIVILGILAAIVVFSVSGITDKGNTSACKADKATVETAVEAYYANQTTSPATYPADLADAKAKLIGPFLHAPWPTEVTYSLDATGHPVVAASGC
jgi:prepilin-type N-terminal cleavage/methylation domain-containing protein